MHTIAPEATEDIINEDVESFSEESSEPEIGKFYLGSDTEKFLFGTWKVKKLLGFYNSWNDASEYPNGQDIIGNELTIQSDYFSSLCLKKYRSYYFRIKKGRRIEKKRH